MHHVHKGYMKNISSEEKSPSTAFFLQIPYLNKMYKAQEYKVEIIYIHYTVYLVLFRLKLLNSNIHYI